MGNNYILKTNKINAWHDPDSVFRNLFADEKNSFYFIRKQGKKQYTFIGSSRSVIEYRIPTDHVTIFEKETIKSVEIDIFSYLNEMLQNQIIEKSKEYSFPFSGGYFGYFGYELKSLTDGKKKYISPYPDSLWFFVTRFFVFDHSEQTISLVALEQSPDDAKVWFDDYEKRLNTLHTFHNVNETKRKGETIVFTPSMSRREYVDAIYECKNYLRRGESYEICLTNQIKTEVKINSFDLFCQVKKTNPTQYLTYLKHEDLAIISSTPESFLEIDDKRTIVSKPIKGTNIRGKTKEEDKAKKLQLQNSEKDLAENLMITDLLRNDLGKICKIGSVTVPILQGIESYKTVYQMVSTVQGTLRDDVSVIENIKTCFPGGSMTGAPKIRTMDILDTLETEARGIYSGALGFLNLDGTASLNIVIRTIIKNKNMLSLGAGGAILYQSDPEKEYNEMLLKARVLMEAIAQTAGAKDYKLEEKEMKTHTVFIALGSNVGDKKKNINNAIELLKKYVTDISVAPLFTNPAKYYESQDDFVNTVLQGQTNLEPEKLLAELQTIEKEVGRQKRFKNGPREIDLDILFYDDLIIDKPDLNIPHPLIQERNFVLKPISEIVPDFIHPVLKKTMRELYDAL